MNIRLTTTVLVTLAGLLAGCSMGGDDEGGGTAAAGATSGTSGNGRTAGAPAPVPSLDADAKPVTSAVHPTAFAPGGKVEIAVMGLRVNARLATLTMRVTPQLPNDGGRNRITPYRLNGDHGLGVSLIDPVNLKRYVVVKDSAGKELQSDDIFTSLANNQPSALSYTFAAPPANVATVDLQYGSWPIFRNIPVQR